MISNSVYVNNEIEIIESKYGKMPRKKVKTAKHYMLKAMNKYGDCKWWLEDDEETGYKQLLENVLILSSDKYLNCVNKLLKRDVNHAEIMFARKGLIKEAEEMYL